MAITRAPDKTNDQSDNGSSSSQDLCSLNRRTERRPKRFMEDIRRKLQIRKGRRVFGRGYNRNYIRMGEKQSSAGSPDIHDSRKGQRGAEWTELQSIKLPREEDITRRDRLNFVTLYDSSTPDPVTPRMEDEEDVEEKQSLDKFSHRVGWLILLLILQSCSGVVLDFFRVLINHHPVVVIFLTMLIGSGGSVGEPNWDTANLVISQEVSPLFS